jgi:hydroxymethylbilane synthase
LSFHYPLSVSRSAYPNTREQPHHPYWLARLQAGALAGQPRRRAAPRQRPYRRDRSHPHGGRPPAGPHFIAPEGLSPNGTGIFIKEIEEASPPAEIDLAVHSLKDLPTEIDPRFTLAAIPPRADARDAFVCESSWGLHMLPSGARVATTSPRRQAMLLALRPDLTFVEMRGNIDTRLRKWSEGEADALVLASAGLDRLGLTEHVHQRFSVDELTPAPGQGALALQVRSPQHPLDTEDPTRDPAIHAAVRALNCATTEYAVTAERAVLAALGGGCQLPLGAYCHNPSTRHPPPRTRWSSHPTATRSPTSCSALRSSPPPTDLGQSVAEALIARGASMELLRRPGTETSNNPQPQP